MIKSPLVISISLLMAGVFMIVSVVSNKKEFVKYPNQYKNLQDLKKQKLFQALDSIEDTKPNQMVFLISTKELNEALYYVIENNQDKLSNIAKDINFQTEIIDEGIMLYVNKKILDVISLQFQLRFNPEIKGNKITLNLIDARLGYIKLPRRQVLKYIKKLNNENLDVDMKYLSIGLTTDFPKQFTLGVITVAKEELRVVVDIDIRNIEDLKEIVKFAVPPNLSYIADIIPFSLLLGNDKDISKKITLKQIQTIMNFVLRYME